MAITIIPPSIHSLLSGEKSSTNININNSNIKEIQTPNQKSFDDIQRNVLQQLRHDDMIKKIKFNSFNTNMILLIGVILLSLLSQSYVIWFYLRGFNLWISLILTSLISYLIINSNNNYDVVFKKLFIYHYIQPFITFLLFGAIIKMDYIVNQSISWNIIGMSLMTIMYLFSRMSNEKEEYELIKDDCELVDLEYLIREICIKPIIMTFSAKWLIENSSSAYLISKNTTIMMICINGILVFSREYILIKNVSYLKLLDMVSRFISIIPVQSHNIYYVELLFMISDIFDDDNDDPKIRIISDISKHKLRDNTNTELNNLIQKIDKMDEGTNIANIKESPHKESINKESLNKDKIIKSITTKSNKLDETEIDRIKTISPHLIEYLRNKKNK